MNFHRIAAACSLTIVVAVAGCAGDPGKKANSADAEISNEQRRGAVEEQERNAEATRKRESANAEALAEKNLATSDAKKDANDAHADLAQDRRDFETKAKERLAKMDAKAKELKTKSAKLNGKKATSFKTHVATFNTQRGEATTKVSDLAGATNEAWSPAKIDLEKKLDNLDSTLEGMGKDL
jgi:hypothetical protein